MEGGKTCFLLPLTQQDHLLLDGTWNLEPTERIAIAIAGVARCTTVSPRREKKIREGKKQRKKRPHSEWSCPFHRHQAPWSLSSTSWSSSRKIQHRTSLIDQTSFRGGRGCAAAAAAAAAAVAQLCQLYRIYTLAVYSYITHFYYNFIK